MCGIVGLFIKNPDLKNSLGRHLSEMLIGMSQRGPDSTGFAIYRDNGLDDSVRLTLFNGMSPSGWDDLAAELETAVGVSVSLEIHSSHAMVTARCTVDDILEWFARHHPEIRIVGYGHSIEIYKEMGLPADVVGRFGLADMSGSHGIGHTRMATESAVTTEHSHPFIAASDICLVHNGSLSNHNRLRRRLQKYGMSFQTDNDSEVAARYVAYRMAEGASLREALEAALKDLDGFYTFAASTIDGFAVVRDGIACKPAVMAETDDWVAMASEFRSLAHLPGADVAKVWEPEPGVVYSWGREQTE